MGVQRDFLKFNLPKSQTKIWKMCLKNKMNKPVFKHLIRDIWTSGGRLNILLCDINISTHFHMFGPIVQFSLWISNFFKFNSHVSSSNTLKIYILWNKSKLTITSKTLETYDTSDSLQPWNKIANLTSYINNIPF